MIYLKKGQALFDNPGIVVYDETGYYDDGAAVICAMIYAPDAPVCRYEAKYIAYGGKVYSITDPEKLAEEVAQINPDNLFGKNKEEVEIDKLVENIVPQESGEIASEPTIEEVTLPETIATEEIIAPSEPIIEPTASPNVKPIFEPATEVPLVSSTDSVADVANEAIIATATIAEDIIEVGSDLNNSAQ